MNDAPVTFGWSGRFRLSLALLCFCAGVHAASLMQVKDAWARPTPPGIHVGAVYFTLLNGATQPDQLLSLVSPLADKVEIHETVTLAGVMSMRPLAQLDCLPGKPIKVSPGGLHVMLTGLKVPLKAGDRVPLTLKFRDAGMLSLNVPVEDREE